MDTKKVVNYDWNQQQRINLLRIHHVIETFAKLFNGTGSLIGRKWSEQDVAVSRRIRGTDIVLRVLESSANSVFGIPAKIPMQLQNVVGAKRDILIIFVDGIQHITVA